jgi:hypothetical protein
MKQYASKQNKKNIQRMKAKESIEYDNDENFFFIVDYTSGGVPYGTTWEQAAEEGLLDLEERTASNRDFPF